LLVVAGNECRTLRRTANRLRNLVDRLPQPADSDDHAGDVARRLDDERRMSEQPGVASEAKVGVDLGVVPKGSLAALLTDCAFPGEDGAPDLVWSRKVRGITEESTALVGVAVNTKLAAPPSRKVTPRARPRPSGQASSGFRLGYRFCLTRLPAAAKLGAIGTVGRIGDKAWQTEPTPARALVPIGGSDTDLTNALDNLQAWQIYHALPDVASVEARYVLNGQPGPWTKGVVDGGFAYTEVQARGKFRSGQHLQTEVRAYDARGRELKLAR
jgi:hypothetical protein